METFLFLLFSFSLLTTSLMVIYAINPIHSVLWLILSFCHATNLLLLFGLEFLAMLFLMVYIGAIAVLFLFVVMMLDVHISEYEQLTFQYFPVGALLVFFFFLEILFIFSKDMMSVYNFKAMISLEWFNWLNLNTDITNMRTLGLVLYTYYVDEFLIASLLLLVAMIGAIVLTMHTKTTVKRQIIYRQTFRNFEKTIKLIRIKN